MENSPCLDQNACRDGVGALPRSDFRDFLTNQSPKNGFQPAEIILWPAGRLSLMRLIESRLVAGLEHLNRLAGHDRRYGMLINELGMPVATQQYAEIIEPGDDTLQFDAVDQEDRERNFVLADKIEKSVLEILWPANALIARLGKTFLPSHIPVSYFVFGAVPGAYCSLRTTGAH
jgi:hypothetical protein